MDSRAQMASTAVEDFENGDFLMATKILTARIRHDPNNYEHYLERSICHHKLGNYQASLEDADAAIRLNPTDYNLHYQRSLALIRLYIFDDAIRSAKKAIELRAKREDTKMSDIFKLIKDHAREMKLVREQAGENVQQQACAVGEFGETAAAATSTSTATIINSNDNKNINNNQSTFASRSVVARGEPVDSTTDRLSSRSQVVRDSSFVSNIDNVAVNNDTMTNNNLVIMNSNSTNNSDSNQAGLKTNVGTNQMVLTIGTMANKVSSSAIHTGNKNESSNINDSNRMSPSAMNATVNNISNLGMSDLQQDHHYNHNHNHSHHHHHPYSHQHNEQQDSHKLEDRGKVSTQFDWNIRRSERIFLHHTNEPGTLSPQLSSGEQGKVAFNTAGGLSRHHVKTGSNPSSVSSASKDHRHLQNKSNDLVYANNAFQNKTRVEAGQNSHLDSEVDVEETNAEQRPQVIVANQNLISNGGNSNGNQHKRVMVAPSSSMPATTPVASNQNASTPKDDSYSSKYKRLRRDRERARRGTSKLCTIRPSDLDELHRASGLDKRYMRVIAPIDGWLYSGQLSVDDNPSEGSADESSHYVVKLDGDSSGSSYLFTQETVLNDVIKEVRVKSVSDLRKGARICCYWSRTYKCLSTGVVTSRTFEATKSLVSVKYDNGDLSALPLEDLRLLPPDYPKYMSNCDPLLLARNSDSMAIQSSEQATATHTTTATTATTTSSSPSSKVAVSGETEGSSCVDETQGSGTIVGSTQMEVVQDDHDHDDDEDDCATELSDSNKLKIDESFVSFQPIDQDDSDDDEVIPPTNQAIDFITNEDIGSDTDEADAALGEHDDEQAKSDLVQTSGTSQLDTTNGSRASSEENNFGVEYRPWVFEGAAKRSKRHGRTYRDNYTSIRRGNEMLKIGDSAELMPRDASVLPFIAKIDGLWCTSRGEMRVRVRWYYRLVEAEGPEPCDLKDGENALFETDHFDENDVQSIWRSAKILSWTDYSKDHLGHVNKQNEGPKVFYLAGYYDPVRRIKHLRSDVKEV